MKLSKKIRRLTAGFVIFFLMPFLLYHTYIAYFVLPYHSIDLKQKISSYEFLEDGKAIAIKLDYDNPLDHWLTKSKKRLYRQDPIVGGSKIVLEYNKLVGFPGRNDHRKPEGQEYWGITVYNAEGGKLTSRDYDVFKIVSEYDSKAIPVNINKTAYISNDRELLDIYLEVTVNDHTEGLFKSIDLNTGQIVERGSEEDRERAESASRFSRLLPLNRDYSFYKYSINYLSSSTGISSDALIRQRSPKAVEIFDQGGTIVILTDNPGIETSVPILQLLYKEGTNLFDDVRIPASSSLDGQEHHVNSQEEFVRYYKPEKNKF